MSEPCKEDWTPNERAALDAWDVPRAPSGLAARALARVGRADRWRKTARLALAAAAVVAIGAAVWALAPRRSSGAFEATARATVPIGSRGVAVLEPGAAVAWSEDGGDVAVTQGRGAAFYRVERGGAFTVRTPAGEVRVQGTCFEVEVRMNKVGVAMAGAAVGAAVTAAVLVTVYEGKVEVASAAGVARPLEAGERARLAPGEPPQVVGERSAASAPMTSPHDIAAGPGASSVGPAGAVAGPAVGAVCAPCDARVVEAERKAKDLAARVASLEGELGDAARRRDLHKTFDIPQEQLLAMAEHCELAWDTIPLPLEGPPKLPRDEIAALGVKPAEMDRIATVVATEHAHLLQTVREVYAAVMGEEAAPAVAPRALIEEIEDKTAPPEMQRIYQALSAERAGLAEPPTGPARTPVERLLRELTTSGDRLESAIAEVVGKPMAHTLRAAHDGFGNSQRSSVGCPE